MLRLELNLQWCSFIDLFWIIYLVLNISILKKFKQIYIFIESSSKHSNVIQNSERTRR